MDSKKDLEQIMTIKTKSDRQIFKLCHICSHVNQSDRELRKCNHCGKAFLPLNYFEKVHSDRGTYDDLFCDSEELIEEELIRGIYVIW